MFIELHRPAPITINVNRIEYFVSTDEDKHTRISMPDHASWLSVEESYEQVKELITEATRK